MRRDRDALAAGVARPRRPRHAGAAVWPGAMSPRTIQREPIAVCRAHVAAVHPTDSPAFSARRRGRAGPTPAPSGDAAVTVPVHEADSTPDADFPTLTDAVVDVVSLREPRRSRKTRRGTPILTDAVRPPTVP
jgi:hypothetical protein